MNTECALKSKGYTHTCRQLYPGQLEKHCDGCINYARQKVIEKYQKREKTW